MQPYYVIVIIFGILSSLLIISLIFINKILNRKNRVELALDSVMKYIKERNSLMERMLDFIKENTLEETTLKNDLNNLNTKLNEIHLKNKYNKIEIEKTNKLLEKFKNLIKIYSFLEKNEIYKDLITEIETNTERFNYAIDIYNKKAKDYNEFKNINKTNKFISKIFRLSDYEFHNN